MGWGNCGVDSKGRSIGYIFAGTCDHPDCLNKIHRGLEYACGDMHGEDEISCEKYFCYDHLTNTILDPSTGRHVGICDDCYKQYLVKNLQPHQPCDHPGCLSHITHPCEGCGRTGGI